MSIRKREWKTGKGIAKEAWVVDYVDQGGVRRLKTFARKKEAEAFASTAAVEVREGIHVADSASCTVQEAGDLWIAARESGEDRLERSTTDQYRQHLKLHIVPFIGDTLLSKLTGPKVRAFEDALRDNGRSKAMIGKVKVSLGSLLADAQERGLVVRNVVRDGKRKTAAKRHKRPLQVGVDIPENGEIRAIVGALKGRWRPLLVTAIFTGLRASELRGLRWADVDFDKRTVNVWQRADRYNEFGPPKSGAGARSVPLPPLALNALREWKLVCPKRDTGRRDDQGNAIRELHLVFPNGSGKVESLANIINRGLIPVQITASVTVDTGKMDDKGRPIRQAKYTGMHTLRHWYASWCINRPEDGGLGLPAKVVQARLGHSTIAMTLDVYGHLFPPGDDADKLAAAERALLA